MFQASPLQLNRSYKFVTNIYYLFCRQVAAKEPKVSESEPIVTNKVAICQMAGWKVNKTPTDYVIEDANVQIYFNLITNKL